MPGPELWEESERGDVVLGGCCISLGQPERACTNCGWEEDRFLKFRRAQLSQYATALLEISALQKDTHWMWFFFPQIAGIPELHGGSSSLTSKEYAIRDIDEAIAYLLDEHLAERYLEFLTPVASHLQEEGVTPSEALLRIFGRPDNQKFVSSITLFFLALLELPTGSNIPYVDAIRAAIEAVLSSGVTLCEDTLKLATRYE
jgi:uncharacterized protein (DUF1810 family)